MTDGKQPEFDPAIEIGEAFGQLLDQLIAEETPEAQISQYQLDTEGLNRLAEILELPEEFVLGRNIVSREPGSEDDMAFIAEIGLDQVTYPELWRDFPNPVEGKAGQPSSGKHITLFIRFYTTDKGKRVGISIDFPKGYSAPAAGTKAGSEYLEIQEQIDALREGWRLKEGWNDVARLLAGSRES